MSVAQNIARFRESVGANPVTLVAVTKTATIDQIEEAFSNGITEFGENKVQTALAKKQELASRTKTESRWHFIGHLQTNKVKQVVGNFSLIHSVDSVRLAMSLAKAAQEKGLVQQALLQVKMVEDPSKFGFSPAELKDAFAEIIGLDGLSVRGLMTITPLESSRETWLKCFNGLRSLRDELAQKHGVELKELSMGMSDDWHEAVACGSTMVRLGRAIFSN
jgi:pyridoxal phosphate enzyme (YggS family)